MSGNSTRLGVGIVQSAASAALAGGLIGAFVVGVAAGSLSGHLAGVNRRVTVLLLVAALLAASAGTQQADAPILASLVLALAMGAVNAVFEREGEVRIGLTYMTGSLVRLGQGIAGILIGNGRWGWLPYLLLWAGFVAGAAIGSSTFNAFGAEALWAATGVALALIPLARGSAGSEAAGGE